MIKTEILILEKEDLLKPHNHNVGIPDFKIRNVEIKKYSIIGFQGDHTEPLKILKNRFGSI